MKSTINQSNDSEIADMSFEDYTVTIDCKGQATMDKKSEETMKELDKDHLIESASLLCSMCKKTQFNVAEFKNHETGKKNNYI